MASFRIVANLGQDTYIKYIMHNVYVLLLPSTGIQPESVANIASYMTTLNHGVFPELLGNRIMNMSHQFTVQQIGYIASGNCTCFITKTIKMLLTQ